jgi:hypothetical protein
MELDASTTISHPMDDWASLLISLGDLVADGYQVTDDVEKYGAIRFLYAYRRISPIDPDHSQP